MDGGDCAAVLDEAAGMLERNWRGDHTVPSGELYPHQWSWDSAFIAIGWSWIDADRARTEIEHLFSGQWSNGMVPHIVFNPDVAEDAYFPGPAFWRSDRAEAGPEHLDTSGITQPPLHARAVLEVFQRTGDRAFLERMYPKLVAQHDHLRRVRDVAGDGLAAIIHPWESGMDNSPAWDDDLADIDIDPDELPDYNRRDLTHADAQDRPSDAAYDRFVYLAARYRDAGYSDADLRQACPFLVEDPLFNTVWLWSSDALADIATLVGDDPAPHRTAAATISGALMRRLWDAAAQRFCARDVRGGRRSPEDTITSLTPVLDRRLSAAVVDRIAALLDSPEFRPRDDSNHFMVSSFDLRARGFDPRRYWRGPIWLNTDWLLWRGLLTHGRLRVADEIAASMVGLVRRSGWREYFSPFGGQGFGSHDFGWTAAVIVDLLHRTRDGAGR